MSEKKFNPAEKAVTREDCGSVMPLTHRAGSAGAFQQDYISLKKDVDTHFTDRRLSSKKAGKVSHRKSSGKYPQSNISALTGNTSWQIRLDGVGEKSGSHKSHAQLEKYERRVHDSYEKQIAKLETTYKSIFETLDAHKDSQINKLRSLQAL